MTVDKGAVRIKKELIDDGIAQGQQKTNRYEQLTSEDSDMIELFDDDDSIGTTASHDGMDDTTTEHESEFLASPDDQPRQYLSGGMENVSDTSSSKTTDSQPRHKAKRNNIAKSLEPPTMEGQAFATTHDEWVDDGGTPGEVSPNANEFDNVQESKQHPRMDKTTPIDYHSNRRPWVSAGSRKKPKNYFSDIKSLQAKMGELITDVDMDESESQLDGGTTTSSPNAVRESTSDGEVIGPSSSVGAEDHEAPRANSVPESSTHSNLTPSPAGTVSCNDQMQADNIPIPVGNKTTEHLAQSINNNASAISSQSTSKNASNQTGSGNNGHGTNGLSKKVSFKKTGLFSGNTYKSSGFQVIAKSQPSTKEKLAQRGSTLIEAERLSVTSIKVEFNIASTVTEYNVREQFLNLVVLFRKYDRKLRVVSSVTESQEWSDFTQLPEDSEFNHSFQLVTREFRNHKKVILHCKLITEKPLNKLKYTEEVKNYIFANNIWLKVDRYDSKEEGSPGFFVMLHPKLINRADFERNLHSVLTKIVPTSEGASNFSQGTFVNGTSSQTSSHYMVPSFHLEVSQKKWGKIKVDVLRVNCAMDDAEKLKQLLVIASEQEGNRHGLFVPVGIHLMTGPNTLTQILRDHATFMVDIRGIPITGISQVQMDSKFEGSNFNLQDSITRLDGVFSVERTRDTQNRGKWLVLTTSAMEDKVLSMVTGILQKLEVAPQSHSFLTAGKRFVSPQGSQMNCVHSYAEALTQKFSTPHSRGSPTKDPMESKSQIPVGRQPRATHPAVPSKSQTNLAQVGHDLKLAEAMFQKRISDMESKWQEVEDRIQQKQTDQNASLEAKLAEQNSKVMDSPNNSIAQYVDNKLAEFTKTQSQSLTEMEDKLLKMVDDKLDQKSDQLSIEVANHVTSRLLEVLNQKGITRPAEVTQESQNTHNGSTLGINNHLTVHSPSSREKLGGTTLHSPNLESKSPIQFDIQRSSHDTKYERNTGIS